MLLKKEGYPEESELVICTVTRIQYNSVFVSLDEFEKSGMLHISEISPGRIRNIRDYVKEGKKIVCLVLRIHEDKGHIDLSLRRVNKNQHREKMEQMKKELKSEKIIEMVAKENKMKPEELHKKVMEDIDYKYISDFFEEIVAENENLESLKLDKKIKDRLQELVFQKIKLPTVELRSKYNITLYEPDGIEKIKKTLLEAKKEGGEKVTITYLGAGEYELKIEDDDYKSAEKILKKTTSVIDKSLSKCQGNVELKRNK
ncbi:MAG: translation initiation factor IF-2 subunit alpha [Candidatus Nanoarchaeia archaeon]